jgi:hypothetical protein
VQKVRERLLPRSWGEQEAIAGEVKMDCGMNKYVRLQGELSYVTCSGMETIGSRYFRTASAGEVTCWLQEERLQGG